MAYDNERRLGDDVIKYLSYVTFLFSLVIIGGCLNENINHKKDEKIVKNINIVEENTIKQSIAKVYDSVLLIEAYNVDGNNSIGSGFIYKTDNTYGYILTNNHVTNNSDSIEVVTNKGDEFTAKLLGFDELTDLAVLRIDRKNVPLVATLGDSSSSNIGDTVFTVGSPEGVEYIGSVTKGIISGLDREIKVQVGYDEYIINVIQTDAAINPGNSGGPLVNINGEVIGINSLKLVENEVEGMGFAIPIEEVLLYTDRLEKGEKIKRPYLGLELVNSDKGILVESVKYDVGTDDIKKGDIITKIDNVAIKDIVHFRYLLYKHEVGDSIEVSYIRNNKQYKTTIVLK